MINRKISESKLLRKVRDVTTKEQFYEAILYETVMSLSHENVEESIKIIDEVINEYPYMRNTLRTSIISAADLFVSGFRTVKVASNNHCFYEQNLKEKCCPRYIEEVAKHYSLDVEIMNTFKFEQPFLNIAFATDSPDSITKYHMGYLFEAILFKASKVITKLYQINQKEFLNELYLILMYVDYYSILLRFLTHDILEILQKVHGSISTKHNYSTMLNECHEIGFIESIYQKYDPNHDLELFTHNLYVSYLMNSHNNKFLEIDLINEFKLRPDKTLDDNDKHSFIKTWCENIIDYVKIDFDAYFRQYHHRILVHNHSEISIEYILERVDMMKQISDSKTILQAAVNSENEEFVKKILEKHPELVIVRDSHGNYVFNYFKKADYLIGSNLRIFEMLSKEVIKRFPKNVLLTILLNETSSRKSFYKKFYKNDIEEFTDFVESIHC